jgi:hypothetical protein
MEMAVVQLGGHPVYIQRTRSGSARARAPRTSPARSPATIRVIAARVFDHGLLERWRRRPTRRCSTCCRTATTRCRAGRPADIKQLSGGSRARGSPMSATATTMSRARWRGLRAARRELIIAARGLPAAAPPAGVGRSPTRPRRSRARTSSTPTSGCRWARTARPSGGWPALAPYQVDEALMALGARRLVPPLPARPARRGSDRRVIDGPRSPSGGRRRTGCTRARRADVAACSRTEVTVHMAKLKVVLAYSGGLDTSIILKWLQTEYDAEVVTFTADLGQGEEVEPARARPSCSASSPRTSSSRTCARSSSATSSSRCSAPTRSTRAVSARHLDRAAADRQAPDRDRAAGRRRRGLPRRDRQGQRPGPLRARLLCAGARHPGHRPVARVGVCQPRAADRLRREAPDPDRQGQARRSPFSIDANLLHSSSARGRCWRIRAQEAPEYVHQRTISPEDAPDKPTEITIDFERGDPVAIDGEALSPGGAADAAQRARPRQRHRPARPGREPLRRHEEPRRLRDAGRHHPARGAPRHREHHARRRRDAPQGRSCRATRA